MSNTTKVTDPERLVQVLYQLRPSDVIEYEGSGGGRKGTVTVHVSEVGERDGTYCVLGEGKQEGKYALLPDGRPSGQTYDPPKPATSEEGGKRRFRTWISTHTGLSYGCASTGR